MITLDDLSPATRAATVNGCGSKAGPFGWLRPPALCFTQACDQHDVDYAVGGGPGAKRDADLRLWAGCRRAVHARAAQHDHGLVHETLSLVAAWLYFAAVRAFGKASFHYGEPRTIADLDKLAGAA